jgi:hypothetical protein
VQARHRGAKYKAVNVPERAVAAVPYAESERSFPSLYRIENFDGREIEVPVAEEDDYPYFVLDQLVDF